MSAYQAQVRESNVRLLNAGSPVTGVAFGDATVEYKKVGGTGFTSKTLATEDWEEIGDGYYALRWSALEMSTLGPFLFKVTGTGFDPFYGEFDIDPPNPFVGTPETCVVYGNIVDLGAEPGRQEELTFQVVDLPHLSSESFVTGGVRKTLTDTSGNFSIDLVREAKVKVVIKIAGVSHVVTVPDQESIKLKDLLPL